MGKILRVDLGTKEILYEDVATEDDEKYIGGAGVAAAIFSREVPADIDPYDEKNLLIFSVGPFCGTMVPFCGRHFVMAKSPLTGIIGEASGGGFFGRELKCAGFDHIIIKGKSEKPVYLWIHEGKAEVRDATDLWGKAGIHKTEMELKKLIGDDKIKTASIGPAGENLIRYAAIINENNHAAGRCGMGAVMGSKKLKAITIRGTGQVMVNNKDKLREATKTLQRIVKENPLANVMKTTGTLAHMDNFISMGDVPIKNYTMSRWKGTKSIGYYALEARGEIKHHACFNCPVGCRANVEYEGKWVAWPEYEMLAMMGSNLFINDLEALIRWNTLLNDLGIDVISLGGALGCFLEAAERNLLDINLDELGFKPDPEKEGSYQIWGSVEPIEKLIKMVAYREGIGNDIAEGVRKFCEIKNLPDDLATHGKGLEVPAHEPRANNLTALDYATTSRGAFHCYEPMQLSAAMTTKKELNLTEKLDNFVTGEVAVNAVIKIQDSSEAYSASGGCIFGFWYTSEIQPWVDALNAITGRSYSVESWVQAGERIFNIKRNYNLDCGITKDDDTFGSRFFTPLPKGGTKKNIPPIKELVSKYYELRGWNAEGRPK